MILSPLNRSFILIFEAPSIFLKFSARKILNNRRLILKSLLSVKKFILTYARQGRTGSWEGVGQIQLEGVHLRWVWGSIQREREVSGFSPGKFWKYGISWTLFKSPNIIIILASLQNFSKFFNFCCRGV